MNLKRWIARREPSWKQLDELLTRVEKRGLRSLQTHEIQRLASLYRSVSADLARARTNQLGDLLVQDLQKLTARGYNQIYQGSRRQDWQALREFALWGFPALVQRTWGYIALSTAIFILGGLVGWWYSWQDPDFLALVVPSHLIETVRRGELWMGNILGHEPTASSGIMVNNLIVSFRVVAGGFVLGLFSLYALFYNGLLIGAVGCLVGKHNLAYPFWAFVFPHGALELPAIFIAGGAGLLVARALLFPGRLKRTEALKFYGLQAGQLSVGMVVMLVAAGIIEGFFSPSTYIPEPVKYLVGTTILVGLIAYCCRSKPKMLPAS
jgi:uncharacterized membrane protein SpoIIM required for sporulation